MTDYELVVTPDPAHSGEGYETYAADVLAHSPYGGPGMVLDHVEVVLAPADGITIFTAAAVAEDKLRDHGWAVVDHITSYGSHGKGIVSREAVA